MARNRDREAGVYGIHQAKSQLSRLVDQVLADGQPVLIGRRGRAEVMLAPMGQGQTAKRRIPGLYRSTLKLAASLPPSPTLPTPHNGGRLRLLLTGQSLVRWLAAPFDLPAQTHAAIEDSATPVAVSTDALRQILAWAQAGTLNLGGLKGRLAAACTGQDIHVLSVTPQAIEKASSLGGDPDAALAALDGWQRG